MCATRLEAWGIRTRAPQLQVLRTGVGETGDAWPLPVSSAVISAGLAGGLAGDIMPGTVVIATSVTNAARVTWDCDPDLIDTLTRATRSLGLPAACGPLLSAGGLVIGAARATWAARGFIAADMESAMIAQRVHRFAVLRIALDCPAHEISGAWADARRAMRSPSAWADLPWLARTAPRCALRAGTVLRDAFLDVDPEV